MRKVDDGKRKKKRKEKKREKRMAFLVAITSLPAVYRANGYATPERRPLERLTLVPIFYQYWYRYSSLL